MKGKILAALGSAGLLAACSGVPVTHSAYWSTFYAPNEAAAAFARKTMPVTVRGNPFDSDPAVLRESVVDAMRTTYSGNSAGFAVSPGGTPDGYHMVARFDPARTQSRLNICVLDADADKSAGTSGGYGLNLGGGTTDGYLSSGSGRRVPIQVAFCFDNEVVTTVSGSTVADGPDDPAVRNLIGNMWYDLLPPRDPKVFPDQDMFVP